MGSGVAVGMGGKVGVGVVVGSGLAVGAGVGSTVGSGVGSTVGSGVGVALPCSSKNSSGTPLPPPQAVIAKHKNRIMRLLLLIVFSPQDQK